jgi:hypothetical protein
MDAALSAGVPALNDSLANHTFLYSPDMDLTFILHCDASTYGIGATLAQMQDGVERPIAFYSRQLNTTEQKYHTTHRELLAVKEAVKHFRMYLLDRPFTIFTDHQPLISLMKKTLIVDARTQRWIWTLFVDWPEVEDAMPNLAIDTPERQKFVHQQHLQWATIYEYLKNQSAPAGMGVYERERFFRHANQFVLHDEILYYLRFPQKVSARLRDINPVPRVLCDPSQFRQEIMKRLHDDPFSGHLSAHRTFSLAVTRFFWEGMYRDIEQYIRSCIQCQTRKVARRRPNVPVMALPIPSRPFERMSVDVLGPISPASPQ